MLHRLCPRRIRLAEFQPEVRFVRGDVRLVYEALESYIQYDPHTGQIGLLYVDAPVRHRGIATQMIQEAAKHVQTEEMWLVGSWDEPFYQHGFGSRFYQANPADVSVTGWGWRIKVVDVLGDSHSSA